MHLGECHWVPAARKEAVTFQGKQKKSFHIRNIAPVPLMLNFTSILLYRFPFLHTLSLHIAGVLSGYLHHSCYHHILRHSLLHELIITGLHAGLKTTSMNPHLDQIQYTMALHSCKHVLVVSLFWLWVTLEVVDWNLLIGLQKFPCSISIFVDAFFYNMWQRHSYVFTSIPS